MARFDSTCWSVVLGAADGVEEHRDAFCRRYEPVIRTYLAARWKLPPDHERVAEAVQDVFVHCFRDRGALTRVDPSHPSGFRGYLYGITRRTAIEIERGYARRRDRPPAAELEFDHLEADEPTLSGAFDRAWAEMVGREASELLRMRAAKSSAASLRCRCLELRYTEGLKAGQIAERLNLAPKRVYELLYLARLEYRATLLEVVGAYHPTASEKELEAICAGFAALL